MHLVNFSWLQSSVTKTFINILLVHALKDLLRFLFRFVSCLFQLYFEELIIDYYTLLDADPSLSVTIVKTQVFAVLLLALSYLALAEKECSAFGNTCRHFLLLNIIGSCFIGYLFIFLSNTGSFRALASANKRKISTLKNPKKLNWCGSLHPTESEPSHSLLIWSWYKAGFKQATIFITFGLALSPVLYKVCVRPMLE